MFLSLNFDLITNFVGLYFAETSTCQLKSFNFNLRGRLNSKLINFDYD